MRHYLIILMVMTWPLYVKGQSVKGESMRLHRLPLTSDHTSKKGSTGKPKLIFLINDAIQQTDNQTVAIFNFVNSLESIPVERHTFREVEKRPKLLKNAAIVWIHQTEGNRPSDYQMSPKLKDAMSQFISKGGNLLLTMKGLHYLNTLGIENRNFTDSLKPYKEDGYGRRLGFHAFVDHPVFAGLNGGVYVIRPGMGGVYRNKPERDTVVSITGMFGADIPEMGKVVAVDWDYIFLREMSKLVFEYQSGRGRVLACGAYIDFLIPNGNADHLRKFTTNCIEYLIDTTNRTPIHHWEYERPRIFECHPLPVSDRLIRAVPASSPWQFPDDPLTLERRFGTNHFYDVAGERAVVMGQERGGIEEVWTHPFMAFRDYKVGIKFAYRDSVYWLDDERPEIIVRPGYFSRQYKFSRAYLKEVLAVHPENPTGVIHYEYRGVYPAELVIRFTTNLRLMWPYSENVTGPVCHGWDPDYHALRVTNGRGDMTLILAGNKEPVSHQAGQFETFVYRNKAEGYQGVATEKAQVSALFTYKLEMNDNLDMVYSATNQGYDSTFAYLNEALYQPVSIFQAAEQKTRRLLSENLMITSPDPEFNMGYRWALVATDRFFVNTPGMGKALVAGYATTRHGWDGGHAINGRPGYGWYFGRDAQWSGLALCDYGDFSKVKSQLQFFNRFQDLNGKIFHEASTSGLIHYDAADATPLYIVLAGKYFRHSYDTAFIRSTWPYIKKAINFCFSTDTDQDKLIENTNVGHGWVEGGKLYGSHSTIYMAGAWGAALKEASQMGKFLKDPDTEYYFLESQEQSNLINHLFWGENQRFYAYGMDKDKSFRHVQTILPAVPIYFRMTDPEKSAVCTREYAGNAFTTNWGARILREDNPWFKPTGYHYGSVWPLFTGWAALADYATGNSISGFAHLMNNLSVYKNWGLGFVEEVLNGANYEPSGVCPHQCWSETMVLQPAIEGMLGLQVNAPQKSLILAPSLPSDWDSLKAEHIRAGDAIISFQYQRKDNKYTYHFNLTGAPMMKINFFPALPPGTEVGKVYLDGEAILVSTYSTGPSQNLSLAFDLKGHSVLTFEYSGGISVLPVVQAPRPGDQAEGLRILSTRYYRNTYQAEVEGLSGSSESLRLWSDFPVESFSENLTPIGKEDKLTGYQIRFQPSETKYQKMILTWKVKRDEP